MHDATITMMEHKIEDRVQSIEDFIIRARMIKVPDFSLIQPHYRVGTARELAEMLVHGLFTLSDAEKDGLIDLLKGTKSKNDTGLKPSSI